MNLRKWLSLGIGLVVILGACAPAEQSSPTEPSSTGSTKAGWEAEWEETLAAAKREGTVVLSGPTRELWRRVLMTFEQDFPEIEVQYTGANSRDFWPRVYRERELGQYLWDLRVGGPDPQVYAAKDKGVLDPVRPLLLLPEVVDESKWAGGLDGIFFDKEKKYVVGFANFVSFMAYVNRDIIPETEFQSIEDLTNPRWKGQIVIQDPRGGAGLNSLQVMLKLYGEDFLKDLLTQQDLVVTSDLRQETEWLIRGRYPIAIGLVPDAFLVFQEQGLKFNIKSLKDSGRSVSTGTAGIQLLNRTLHPNAAKVYINWLLTKEVQTRISAATHQNSRHLEVPPADPEAVPDPQRLDAYIPSQVEELLPIRQRAQQLTIELLH